MKAFWFAQFYVASSLAVLLLNGCGNIAAQQGTISGKGACIETELSGCDERWAKDVAPKETVRATYTERECADKQRFLLMSEDGKWHCLKLTP